MKIDDHVRILQDLWRQGYEKGVSIKMLREQIGIAGRSDKYWISAQISLIEEFGYVTHLHDAIWKINPEKIFHDWDQDAHNRLLQQGQEDTAPSAVAEVDPGKQGLKPDEMTNEQLREENRKLKIGIRAQEDLAMLTQLETVAAAEREKNDAIEEVWKKVREELEYEIRNEIRILVGEELDRRLGTPRATDEPGEEKDAGTLPAMPE